MKKAVPTQFAGKLNVGSVVVWMSDPVWLKGEDAPRRVRRVGDVIDVEDDGTLVVKRANGAICSVDPDRVTDVRWFMLRK